MQFYIFSSFNPSYIVNSFLQSAVTLLYLLIICLNNWFLYVRLIFKYPVISFIKCSASSEGNSRSNGQHIPIYFRAQKFIHIWRQPLTKNLTVIND